MQHLRRGRTLGASHRLAWVNGQPGAVMYDPEGRVVGVVELDVAEAWSRRSALWSIQLGHIRPVCDVARLPNTAESNTAGCR